MCVCVCVCVCPSGWSCDTNRATQSTSKSKFPATTATIQSQYSATQRQKTAVHAQGARMRTHVTEFVGQWGASRVCIRVFAGKCGPGERPKIGHRMWQRFLCLFCRGWGWRLHYQETLDPPLAYQAKTKLTTLVGFTDIQTTPVRTGYTASTVTLPSRRVTRCVPTEVAQQTGAAPTERRRVQKRAPGRSA